ncbi:unnamed protein product, partial [Brenthis ino]
MERQQTIELVLEKRETLLKSVSDTLNHNDAWPTVLAQAEPGAPARLPPPRWAHSQEPLHLTSELHEDLVTQAESILRKLLVDNNYDSVSNLISLYDRWEKKKTSLYTMFEDYAPPIKRGKHTCVGLGMGLVQKLRPLNKQFPGLETAIALISCEEAVVDIRDYVMMGEGPASVEHAEKEHVMVGIQVVIDGRPGIMLADPGYHVARIITVMADRAYPHTGWFTKSEEPHCTKEYEYSFNPNNSNYVEWHERVTRGTSVKYQTSLIYAAQPYLDSIQVTEKRNLVYNFRSLLARDPKGNLVAGIYFPIGQHNKDASFTLFSDRGSEKRRTKYKFSAFTDPDNINPTVREEIERCSVQMRYKKRALLGVIMKLTKLLNNEAFINQMLDINDEICRMSL